MYYRVLAILLTLLSATQIVFAEKPVDYALNSEVSVTDLESMTNAILMDVQISSAAKKKQNLSKTAAAVFVVTAKDIRRTGATTIAEALRIVPGMNVARNDGNAWSISARGFTSKYANKLLVLIDGRSVYTPFFSGTYWDVQDYVMEDIERIEVIRGPGATIWGANAVNGVINVITKSSLQTQGTMVNVTAGSEDRVTSEARYGGEINDQYSYRVYAKGFNREGFENEDGSDFEDDWWQIRSGFRVDGVPEDGKVVTIQGDAYKGEWDGELSHATFAPPYTTNTAGEDEVSGGNVLARWNSDLPQSQNVSVQGYVDYAKRINESLDDEITTYDLEILYRNEFASNHSFVAGSGYRIVAGRSKPEGDHISFNPGSSEDHNGNFFVQDELGFLDQNLLLTLGAKAEYAEYVGWEFLPNARLLYAANESTSIWTAVSRAVRTVNRLEETLDFVGAVFPNPDGSLAGVHIHR